MDYIKYIKLINGDNIIVTTDSDCKNFKEKKVIMIVNPIQIISLKINQGPLIIESFTMSSWIKMATSDALELPTENIVIIVDLLPEAVEQYKKFVEDINKEELEVNDTSQKDVEELIEELRQEENDRKIIGQTKRKKFNTTFH